MFNFSMQRNLERGKKRKRKQEKDSVYKSLQHKQHKTFWKINNCCSTEYNIYLNESRKEASKLLNLCFFKNLNLKIYNVYKPN